MGLKGFNLLQGNTAPPDLWDKTYAWVTNIGRIIVIIVQIVVIMSFLIRIVVDTQTKNLKEEEKAREQILTSFKQQEIEFRNLQTQFQAYKDIWNISSSYSDIFKEILSYMPKRAREINISIKDNIISVKGESEVSLIGTFESKLKNSKNFSNVQVLEVESLSSNTRSDTRNSNTNIALFGFKIEVKEELLKEREQINAIPPVQNSEISVPQNNITNNLTQ